MDKPLQDAIWLVLCSALVFNMQLGFLCLESGVTRSKNAINVAVKNMTDFAVSVLLYWLFGFGIMFGASHSGWFGSSRFFPDLGAEGAWIASFFLFQAMFCATAATILSGAAAERLRFAPYLIAGALIAGLIYPVFGHWAWASSEGQGSGWLVAAGFVDFAGSTVVHSVGGWVALAVLLIIGPRTDRFSRGAGARTLPGSNLPLAMLGALLLFFGWFGFNGGSTFAVEGQIPAIVVNTLFGGVAGVAAVLAVNLRFSGFADAVQCMNGLLAGLVGVTAAAHAISSGEAILIGAVAGLVMLAADQLLILWRIDDAVGAVPVHLAAGIWGTLAAGLFGSPELLGTGLGFAAQVLAQLKGIAVCGIWSFGVAYLALYTLNRWWPLRVDPESERRGLNVSEHHVRTELLELLEAMEAHEKKGDLHSEVPVEPFTEVGQIAGQYNRVIRALRRAVDRTHAIIRDIRDGVVTFTADGVITSLNPGAQRLFGLSPRAGGLNLGNLLGRQWQQSFATSLPQPGGEVKHEVRCRRRDGSDFLAEFTISQDAQANTGLYTGMFRDISEQRKVEEQLFHEKNLAQTTLASIGDGVITTDRSGRITYLNPVAEDLTGWSRTEAEGRPLAEVYALVDEVTNARLPDPLRDVLRMVRGAEQPSCPVNRALVRRNGEHVPIQDAAAPIRDAEGRFVGAVVSFRDVSVTRKLAKELSRQAAHDALTGLINRAEFERQLAALLREGSQETSDGHVLCYLDLDQFKVVNDTCGHSAGDELLRQLSRVFKSRVRSSDLLARLGGDEFAVVFHSCTIEQAIQVAESIREAVEAFRFSWLQKSFAVGVSMGLVPIDFESGSLAPTMSAADAACYAAKEAGRNRIHIYEPDDQRLLERKGEMLWVNRIRRALDEDRFRLYVQPIVPLDPDTESSPRYEVLVRMLGENGKTIPPGAFMPAAERYNVASAIDRWVVANTLAWVGDYARKHGGRAGHYSINLVADSLCDREFLPFVLERIQREGVPPELICFEITETSAMANLSSAIAFMQQLKAIGCSFALDDFGSGFSSFGYLKNLPVDYLKIDGVFVKDVHRDQIARVMVASIHAIGKEMNIRTVAEFVDSNEVLEELRDIGVDFAQGFHLGRPTPLHSLSEVRMMPR